MRNYVLLYVLFGLLFICSFLIRNIIVFSLFLLNPKTWFAFFLQDAPV